MRCKWLGLACVGLVAAAATLLTGSRNASAAGLLVAEGPFGGVLEMTEQDVHVTINNSIAVTEVTQVFHNTEDRVVEALYTFPVPRGASVANFSMWINGTEMIGEVVEKERARVIYESYKQTRRDPGLLEQVDYKRFEMRIFPIPPGADQKVKIEYYQELESDHDWATYVYPLATATRGEANQRTTGRLAFELEVKSEIPLVDIRSPSHANDFVTVTHTPNYYQASYETNGGDLSRDIVVNYHVERPRTGLDLVTSRHNGEDGYFLMTVTVGKELEEASSGMDYVFLVDVSGSMANDGKLRLSRDCVRAFVSSLSPADRVEMLAFNITPATLFQEVRTADEQAMAAAMEFLESQRARGGTILRPALETAYKYKDSDRPLNVVILSDGMTEQSEQAELVRLIHQSPPGTRVFCVGVGNEVNRPLLSQLAEEAGGLAAFLSHGDDFQQQAQAFRRKLSRPAGTNLQLTFDGGQVYDVVPEKLPNLYHGAPLRIYGRYRDPGQVAVTLEGDILGAPLKQTATLELPPKDNQNPEIERMWAYQNVQHLLRNAWKNNPAGPDSEVAANVIRLCEEYSIVSQYTSFIVLENDAEYRRWKIERRNSNRTTRDRAARGQLQDQLARLREKSLRNLGPDRKDDPLALNTGLELDPAAAARQPASGSTPSPASPNPSRGFDVSTDGGRRSGGGGGGGAIDPISGLVAAGLAGASLLAARRRRQRVRPSK